MEKVLIVEDDTELLEGLKENLEVEGYEVVTAGNGELAIRQVARHRPDAIVLDIMLPKMGGFDVCRHLRARGINIPILILTARSQLSDKVLGLELGADDYVTKPFSIHELLARIRVMLRRSSGCTGMPDAFRRGDIEVNFRRQQVRKGGRRISLSNLEFEVLRYLMVRHGEIVTREQLLGAVWGYDMCATTRAVDNLIGRLRQKLEDDPHSPQRILTVHGVGYKCVN